MTIRLLPDDKHLQVEYVDPEALSPHPRNPRQGDVAAIRESIDSNGVYRPVIAQRSTGHILAGNHTYQAMLQAGHTEIPVVYRDVDDQTAIRILLADNRTADLGSYDMDQLQSLLEGLESTEGTGYTDEDLEGMGDLAALANDSPEDWYTDKVEIPQYEVVGPCPAAEDLVDTTRTQELLAKIEHTDGLPAGVAAFLRLAAYRHTRINYRLVAEFYPHATPEVQRLMEDSALVIVDLQDAIRNGFAKFHKTIQGLEVEDRDPEDAPEED